MINLKGKRVGALMDRNDFLHTDEERRWIAVLNRLESADGSFVYAVVTTGVYCRPSCPSRKPKRENIRFYDRSQDAEGDGFRPCRRCRPDRSAESNRMDERILRACRMMDEAAEPLPLKYLSAAVGLSLFHFQRLFKKQVGISPKEYHSARRTSRLKQGLGNGSSVTEAIYEAGYGSSSRFYEGADRELGMTPTEFKKGGPGTVIEYAVAPSSLGPALVAATSRGICGIEFGDSENDLVQRLRDRFPKAELKKAGPDFKHLIEQVTALIDSPGRGADLPLDIQGTAFERLVWKALRQIPPGTTSTYSEVARRIGRPKAARAVARACASNKIAVAIPCHRVVRKDGHLAGYRWGVIRKQTLLDREAVKNGDSGDRPR